MRITVNNKIKNKWISRKIWQKNSAVTSPYLTPAALIKSRASELVSLASMLDPAAFGWGSRRSPDRPMPWERPKHLLATRLEYTRPSLSPTPQLAGKLFESISDKCLNKLSTSCSLHPI